MLEDAIAWAETVLRTPVVTTAPLHGGMTSTMLELVNPWGATSVLRLMTNEPWRAHGPDLTRREQRAQRVLGPTPVPAPASLGLDAEGATTGVAAHLMTRVPGTADFLPDRSAVSAMADMLAIIHAVEPDEPFREYQSWAWPAKWVVPAWTRHPGSWQRAFDLLAGAPPAYEPTFLHRDYSHRNLLWTDRTITGVVDWVETSTGPAWLDAGHAATNLAVACGPDPAQQFLADYAAATATEPDPYWLVMDTVGFLPPPGRKPMFGSAAELDRLDEWLHHVVAGP